MHKRTPLQPAKKSGERRLHSYSPRIYTLEVFLLGGPISEKFAKKNPVVSRMIQMRSDQTLQDLHEVIFSAFDRWENHFYEFQLGKGPMDPKGKRYVLPQAFETEIQDKQSPAGRVDRTALGSLHLRKGQSFGYWFDFGDDWWHQINVKAVDDCIPRGKYPKIIKRVGESPPQYTKEEEDDDAEEENT